VVKVIWVVIVVHQNVLQIMRRTYKHTLLMKMVILIMTILMLLIWILLIFFAKPNGSIDHLISYESVKKIILIFTFIWKTNVGNSTNDEDMCLIDNATTYTILKNNKLFSCLIMWNIKISIICSTPNIFEGSGKAIILLPRSWIKTY